MNKKKLKKVDKEYISFLSKQNEYLKDLITRLTRRNLDLNELIEKHIFTPESGQPIKKDEVINDEVTNLIVRY